MPAEVIQRTSAPPGGIGRGAGGLADIVNSLLSGPGGESLMTMASQMAQSPEMAQIADQFLGPPPSSSAGQGAGGQARPPPNLGQLMSNMMPMVQTMLGGLQPQGGRGSRVSPSAGTHANSPGGLEGDGEDWRSSLSAEELANWEAVMAADEEAMVAAESTDRPPLSDVYLAGGRTPSTQSRNPFS